MRWLLLIPLVMFAMSNATMLGMLVDPWAPFRLQAADVRQVDVSGGPQAAVQVDAASIPLIHGGVSDVFRYQLARAAGWNAADAITAVAVSIAEDGAGDPWARCFNCVRGVSEDSRGLWMINVLAHPQFASLNLFDPATNARVAHSIYVGAGWCSWSTYESSCGVGWNGAYRAYLSRAVAASQVQLPAGQA